MQTNQAWPNQQESGNKLPGRQRLEWEQKIKSGANWFYWIAALSVVNSILIITGSEWSFIVGLGITQIVDGIAWGISQETGNTILPYIAFGLNLGIAGLFALFGYMANQKKGWAFGVGMGLYAIDALIFLLVMDFLSIGFHVFALICIYSGYKAYKEFSEAPIQRTVFVNQQKEFSGMPQ
ncbi:MAG: hypothetical protein ABIJ45_10850 [Candidatus Zixiibacteriota bacterium]